MSRIVSPVALAAGLLAVLAGCDLNEGAVSENGTEMDPGMERLPESPSAYEAPSAGRADAVLTTAVSPTYGTHLTDHEGRAVYLLEADPPGESTCYDACAVMWPPVYVTEGIPAAQDPGVTGSITTIRRNDGTTQVAYEGHPLYYYSRDERPGQTAGQGLHDEWGEWYLVTPEGEPLEGEPSERSAEAPPS